MKKKLTFKNKIYRRYRTEFWGRVILQGKQTLLFKYLIDNYKRDSTKEFFTVFRLFEQRELFLSKRYQKTLKKLNFLQLPRKTRINLLNKFKSQKEFFYLNKWKNFFWLNFKSNRLHLKNDFNLTKERNFSPVLWKKNLGTILIYSLKRQKYKIYKKILRLEKAIKEKIIHSEEDTWEIKALKKKLSKSQDVRLNSYMENLIKLAYSTHLKDKMSFKSFGRKQSLIRLRNQQLKISIFFGIENRKKFRLMKNLTFKSMKLRAFLVIRLELFLSTILFKLNLFETVYFAKNFIRIGGCFIDNKKIVYPFYSLKLQQVLVINKKFFKKIFNKFFKKLYFFSWGYLKKKRGFLNKYKLTRLKVMMNKPNYIEANYKILHFLIWRLPNKKELISPYSYPVTYGAFNWSIKPKTHYW